MKFNSYEIFYDSTRKMWPFNTGDYLIEVTPWAGLILMRIFKPMKIFEAKEKNPFYCVQM